MDHLSLHRRTARYLLENAQALPDKDWTMQGFGFLRLRLDDNTRLHIWDSRLRTPGVSDIHDHTQWAFESLIVSGSVVNIRYEVNHIDSDGVRFNMATIKCGIGGGMEKCDPVLVRLAAKAPEHYLPGDHYRQEPDEVHRSLAADGTVTVITQQRHQVDTARVFWPAGGEWGDAVPRQATSKEKHDVISYALSIFG